MTKTVYTDGSNKPDEYTNSYSSGSNENAIISYGYTIQPRKYHFISNGTDDEIHPLL